MNRGYWILGALGLLSLAGGGVVTLELAERQKRNIEVIRREAERQGVPLKVALAFAWLESRLNDAAEGDALWAIKRPEMYKKLVVENPAFVDNPWRDEAPRWHSYGLFQLLAPYHVQGREDPRSLLNPTTNAQRGVALIKRLLVKYNGDVNAARIAYTGASGTTAEYKKDLLARLRDAQTKFAHIA